MNAAWTAFTAAIFVVWVLNAIEDIVKGESAFWSIAWSGFLAASLVMHISGEWR